MQLGVRGGERMDMLDGDLRHVGVRGRGLSIRLLGIGLCSVQDGLVWIGMRDLRLPRAWPMRRRIWRV